MLPSCKRSLDEVTQSCFISYALCRDTQEFLWEDLIRGDRLCQSDIAFQIQNTVLVYEHDPVFWHDDNRDDATKTLKLLHDPNVIVVRGRIGASKLQHPEFDTRLIQLILPEKTKHIDTLHAFIRAIQPHFPNISFRIPTKNMQKKLVSFAKDMFKIIHPNYDSKVLERKQLFQSENLNNKPEDFVRVPMSTLRQNIFLLKDTLQITGSKLAQCATLLTKNSDTLREKARILKDEFKITTSKLAQCASLLSYNPDTLREKARILKDEFEITGSKLTKSASLLSRNPDTLRENARILKDEFKITTSKLAPLLSYNPDTLREKARIYTTQLNITIHQLAKCPSLLTCNPTQVIHTKLWYDTINVDWRTDLSILQYSLDRIKTNFTFFTRTCKIPLEKIRKRRLCRFKVKPNHLNRAKCVEFSNLTHAQKIQILDALSKA
jgi:hypothetical protein